MRETKTSLRFNCLCFQAIVSSNIVSRMWHKIYAAVLYISFAIIDRSTRTAKLFHRERFAIYGNVMMAYKSHVYMHMLNPQLLMQVLAIRTYIRM